MTDAEIYQMASEEWLSVLGRLWTAYSKDIELDRLQLYQDMLKNIPFGLLEKAVGRVVSEHVYNSVPTVAQVLAAIRKELGNPYDLDQAVYEWIQARNPEKAIYRFEGEKVTA
jgi:hypothetical protein